jgi:hypothetical protein
MPELIARTALKKARYFLAQAVAAQNDDAILNDRLPFGANLEAAIIYARSSLDYLRNELKPVHNQVRYKRWHEDRLETLKKTNPVFKYFTDRRDFIIHQEPEKTNAQISIAARVSASSSVSLRMNVIRADGTIKEDKVVASSAPPPSKATADMERGALKTGHTFVFVDPDWRKNPAVEYVEDFIDVCGSFICEAENKFPEQQRRGYF